MCYQNRTTAKATDTDVELYFAEICLAEKFCIARAAAIIPPEKARKNKAKKFLLDLRYVNGA
jgi:hypothetical protein